MTIRQTLRDAIAQLDSSISHIDPAAWHRPTPCAEWDVRELVNHVAGECAWIPPLLAGKTIAEVGDSIPGDVLGQDPAAAWRRVASDALDAATDPAALTRTVHLSSGESTGAAYLAEVSADLIIHAWDLAHALGRGDRLPDALVEHAAATLGPQVEEWRAAGALGDAIEVPADSDPQTRLLAMVGRRANAPAG